MRPDLLHWEVYHCTKIKDAAAETGKEQCQGPRHIVQLVLADRDEHGNT